MDATRHLFSRRAFVGHAAAAASMTALAALGAGCAGPTASPRKTGMLPVDGGELYCEEAGSGEAVLLLHGFTLDTRMWDDQFEVLARRYRVVRYDLRGFGRSTLPTKPYVHADDCRQVMEGLGIRRAHVVGLSAGGRIAIDVAVRHPQVVDRLVAVDTFVGGYVTTQAYRDAFGEMNAAGRAGNVAKAKKLWLEHPLFVPAGTRPDVVERLRQMVQTYSGYHWVQANPEVPLDPPALARLRELRVPLLVIVGEQDIPDVHAMSDLLVRDVRGARKRVIPGVGHMSNMEAPAAVNAALLEFLAA